MKKTPHYIILLAFLFNSPLCAQDMFGLGTGNFTGIAGMTLNPASIVDNRLKFDLNLIGVSNYFTNNYLSVKRDAFIDGSFFKSKYKDWAQVQRDLLQENTLRPGEKVYARLNNRVQAPLSFMVTTGQRSAVAFNISNRTGVIANNIDQSFARLAYNQFESAGLYNQDFIMNGVNATVLNWLTAGFTYGRVLLNEDKHFIKAAFTGKYIGGVGSGYFEADELTLRFNDKNSINAQTPYMQYGHGEKLSLDMFKAASLSSLRSEAESFGWDAGIVYEYRGRIEKFKYLTPEYEEKTRRDYNKYAFRLGVSIMDAGRLTFNKGGFNNDFSANITEWDLRSYDIRSINDVDTMLAGRVSYPYTGEGTYSVALPTALSTQLDLHLWKGFYVNLMTYQPLQLQNADRKLKVAPLYAILPRFESRVFGIYIPVSYNNIDDWNIGASLRLGPLYAGSSNLGSLLFNSKVKTTDVHAGLRIPIAFGSPSKVAKLFDKVTTPLATDKVKRIDTVPAAAIAADSTANKNNELIQQIYRRLEALEKQMFIDSVSRAARAAQAPVERTQNPVTININNYAQDNRPGIVTQADTVLSPTALPKKRRDTLKRIQPAKAKPTAATTDTTRVLIEKADRKTADSTSILLRQQEENIDTLLHRLAAKELELQEINNRLQQIEENAARQRADTIQKIQPKEKEPKKKFRLFKKKMKDTVDETSSLQQEKRWAPANDTITNKEAVNKQPVVLKPGRDTVHPATVKPGNSALANEISRLREELRIHRSEVNRKINMANDKTTYVPQYNRNNDRPINVHLPAVTVPPYTPVAPAPPVIIRDTVYLEKKDTRKQARQPSQKQDTVYITQTDTVKVAPVITRPPVIDNTPNNLVNMSLEKILFNTSQNTIKPTYFGTLNFVAAQLKKYPALILHIDGYTDKSGNAAINERLSKQRADAVKNYLLKKGVPGNQLKTANHGANAPVADNTTATGKVLNRRVELRFSFSPLL